jgi:hypothetical protein
VTSYFKDLLVRVGATFAFTFLSLFSLEDLGTADNAAIAGGAAALALVQAALGKYVGDRNNAGITK